MKKANEKKYKTITVSTPPELYKTLKVLKKQKIISKLSWFIVDAIFEKINKENIVSLSNKYKKQYELFLKNE